MGKLRVQNKTLYSSLDRVETNTFRDPPPPCFQIKSGDFCAPPPSFNMSKTSSYCIKNIPKLFRPPLPFRRGKTSLPPPPPPPPPSSCFVAPFPVISDQSLGWSRVVICSKMCKSPFLDPHAQCVLTPPKR